MVSAEKEVDRVTKWHRCDEAEEGAIPWQWGHFPTTFRHAPQYKRLGTQHIPSLQTCRRGVAKWARKLNGIARGLTEEREKETKFWAPGLYHMKGLEKKAGTNVGHCEWGTKGQNQAYTVPEKAAEGVPGQLHQVQLKQGLWWMSSVKIQVASDLKKAIPTNVEGTRAQLTWVENERGVRQQVSTAYMGSSLQDKDQRNGAGGREEYGGQGKYLFFNIDDIQVYLHIDRNK